MKKNIFLLLLFLSGYQAVAPTLYTLLIADIKDGLTSASFEKTTDHGLNIIERSNSFSLLYLNAINNTVTGNEK
jgi:hypothetical protein